jgi:elongation factor Ts
MDHYNHYIESYVHNGRIGVLIELDLSDPIVTRIDVFTNLAKDLAIHIAALASNSVDELLQQPFVKNPSITIDQLISGEANTLREQISVTRFVRWDSEPTKPETPEPPRSPAVIYRLRGAE